MFTPAQEQYLNSIVIPLRLACVTQSGWPMVLSLWYLYDSGVLMCATQSSARVVAYLREQPKCAFEIASEVPPYCGVRGQGRAIIRSDADGEVLTRLLTRYLGSTDQPLAKRLLKKRASEVSISITPLQVFSWNYSSRMTTSSPIQPGKICPS